MKRTIAAYAVAASAVGSALVVAVLLPASAASCSAASDFVPYPCAAVAFLSADGGDGGLVPNGDFVPSLSAARIAAPNACDSPASALAGSVVTISQCDNSFDAIYRTTDGGPFFVDYYNAATNLFVARVSFATSSDDGVCTIGPAAFSPPTCTGSSAICCGSDAGYDAGYDAGDAGCGNF